MYKFIVVLSLLLTINANAWASGSNTRTNGSRSHQGVQLQVTYTHQNDLLQDAIVFERQSERLYRRLKKEIGRDRLTRNARELSTAAASFRYDVEHGARQRELKHRFATLSDCLVQLKRAFYRHEYTALSRRARARLDETLYALNELEDNFDRPRHYSYNFKPRGPATEYDRRSRPGEYRR